MRNPNYENFVKKVMSDGYYLGPHSDKHLLYCDWDKPDKLMVERNEFENDLRRNYVELKKFSVSRAGAEWFMPPYEWYNSVIVDWSRAMGLSVVNFTPGIRTSADYTTPGMASYMSSDDIMASVFQFEKADSKGLNGCIILIHPGTEPARKDKFYERLPEFISRLKKMSYKFKRL